MAYRRILTIQDISCVGQCSMTVALPILSACGHETCILPTAVLSTHTGGFGKPEAIHLEGVLETFWRHWEKNEIVFDGILTGYLGSVEAVCAVERIADAMLAPEGMLIVDPAMADHGKRYSGLTAEYAQSMDALCRRADLILPNVTEAAMFSGMDYREELTEAYVHALMDNLAHPNVVLTGVGYREGETGVVLKEGNSLQHYSHPLIGKSYHGTGDMFAAAFTGALLQGKTGMEAASIAGDFVCEAIRQTAEAPAHWYGVKFEKALPYLIRRLNG